MIFVSTVFSLRLNITGIHSFFLIAIGVSNLGTTTKERPKTNWTPAMDRYFVKLMLNQLKKGNKINNIFRRQAWKDMLTSFNTKFSSQYGEKILKHRYKKLFKYYTNLRSILEEKGFFWDEKQQRIVANAVIWDNYIRVYSCFPFFITINFFFV